MKLTAACLCALFAVSCGGAPTPPPAAGERGTVSITTQTTPSGAVTLPSGYPERPFARAQFDKLTWRPTEGNKLGVETFGRSR